MVQTWIAFMSGKVKIHGFLDKYAIFMSYAEKYMIVMQRRHHSIRKAAKLTLLLCAYESGKDHFALTRGINFGHYCFLPQNRPTYPSSL